MALVCITNSMNDVRSCTVRGQHELVCDGWQYRYNRQTGREEATGRECKGCLPREAKKGMLCYSCWEKVEQAFADWTSDLENALGNNDRLVQRDNAGIRSQIVGYVNMPSTALALDEIRSYLRSCPATADLWVSTVDGAKDAIRFARAVPVAKRTFEIEEKQRQMRRVRCPKCKQQQPSLMRKPPEFFKDLVRVVCETPGCGKVITDIDKLVAIAKIERIA